MQPTVVLFTQNIFEADAEILLLGEYQGKQWLVTDQTPFHPVSHLWADHPADRGYVERQGQRTLVVDCLTAAYHQESGELQIDSAITARRGEEGWIFVVVHLLQDAIDVRVGDKLIWQVDEDYQASLSRGHTAGHLASMALNKVLAAAYWRKEADRRDPLGHPDFNSYAQQSSQVTPDQCVDIYRLGKTLRKRGLNAADVLADLESIAEAVNVQLTAWVSSKADVDIQHDGPLLTDSRYWRCHLPAEDGLAVMPCGGTHVQTLACFDKISVELSVSDVQSIVMTTRTYGYE
ncbi:alanyl-tRNA editing protein [Thaumasiovibrio sp. DFM-14]|uniref:alanyl-tRNA editing protein n=1 Tax=Thaumasiovibrio sp. DFM-14 TaxID=3384792 RepID=UPI00399FCDC8